MWAVFSSDGACGGITHHQGQIELPPGDWSIPERWTLADNNELIDNYPDKTEPELLTELLLAQEQATLAAAAAAAAAPHVRPTYSLFKTVVISRMTDDELEIFDSALSAATVRERRMWTDCTIIESHDAYFPLLLEKFTAVYGEERAEAILAHP